MPLNLGTTPRGKGDGDSFHESARSHRGATGSVTLRALHLLDAYLPGNTHYTLTELAEHANMPMSTAHRLIADLVAWGALRRESDGRYVIGHRLRQVAASAPHATLLREVCLPHLEDLAELTGQTALLGVLDHGRVVYLEEAHGEESRFRPVGREPAALGTAVGRVLAAYAPRHVRETLLAEPIEPLTTRTITSSARLRELLQQVRRQHFSVAEREVDPRNTVIAAPVLERDANVRAAIALVIPAEIDQQQTLVQWCVAAGRAAGRALSGTRAE